MFRLKNVGVALCCASIMLAATASYAFAVFPGRNGRIAYLIPGECGSNCFKGQIETVLPRGDERRVVVADAQDQLEFSPDGRSLAYSTSEAVERRLVLIDADGGGRPHWVKTPSLPSSPAWDATGQRLVYEASDAGGSGSGERALYVYDGHHSKRLTGGRYPAWSSTNRIAFFRHDGLYLIRPDGSGRRRISAHPALFSPYDRQLRTLHPDWSPDGRWLVFGGSNEGVGGSVYRIRADGSGLQRLARGESPSFSPDGTSIAFRGFDGAPSLMVMAINGSHPRMIARANAVATAWQPLPIRSSAEPPPGRTGAARRHRVASSAPEGASRSAGKDSSASGTLVAIAAIFVVAVVGAAMHRKRRVRANRNNRYNAT